MELGTELHWAKTDETDAIAIIRVSDNIHNCLPTVEGDKASVFLRNVCPSVKLFIVKNKYWLKKDSIAKKEMPAPSLKIGRGGLEAEVYSLFFKSRTKQHCPSGTANTCQCSKKELFEMSKKKSENQLLVRKKKRIDHEGSFFNQVERKYLENLLGQPGKTA